jgi:SAM-dependent methyltransferase
MTSMSAEGEHQVDVWAIGAAYEPYIGRWSRLVAQEFVSWLGVASGSSWLDVGCGTGALTGAILAAASPIRVKGIDPSAGYIAYASDSVRDNRATFQIGDAQALPEQEASFDAVVSGLVLNFVPDPAKAVSEMVRVARPAGAVGVYVWDYAGEMQIIRRFWDAAVELDPAAQDLDEGRRFPLCNPGTLERLFADAGLQIVQVRPIDIAAEFFNFDDYWSPFLGGQGPAPSYLMSLPVNHRTALRERLRELLPPAADGSIHLNARTWAVKAIR